MPSWPAHPQKARNTGTRPRRNFRRPGSPPFAAGRRPPAVSPAPPEAERTLSPEQPVRDERTGTVGASKHIEPLSKTLPPHTLAEIEASRSRSIGPLAKQLVRKAAAAARSVEACFDQLAAKVRKGLERIAFLPRVRRLDIGNSVASHPPEPVTAASAARVAPAPAVVFDAELLARCRRAA